LNTSLFLFIYLSFKTCGATNSLLFFVSVFVLLVIYISEHCTVVYLFLFQLYFKLIQSLLYYFKIIYCIILSCLFVAIHFRHKVSVLNRESLPFLYILYISKLYNVLFFVIIVPNTFCLDARYTVYLKFDMIVILCL